MVHFYKVVFIKICCRLLPISNIGTLKNDEKMHPRQCDQKKIAKCL